MKRKEHKVSLIADTCRPHAVLSPDHPSGTWCWTNRRVLGVISSRWGPAREEDTSEWGRLWCWSTGHFSQPINHLGLVCFVSFSPVLGFIHCALKSNTLSPHTRLETKLSLTNTHKHLCTLKFDSSARSLDMCVQPCTCRKAHHAYIHMSTGFHKSKDFVNFTFLSKSCGLCQPFKKL